MVCKLYYSCSHCRKSSNSLCNNWYKTLCSCCNLSTDDNAKLLQQLKSGFKCTINPKQVREWFEPSLLLFFVNCLLKREAEALLFCNFYNYPESHFSWKFHWVPPVFQKIRRFSSPVLTILIIFFWILQYSVVIKKLITSVYNRWFQHL